MAAFSRGMVRVAIIGCFILILVTISVFYDTRAAEYAVRNRALSAQHVLAKPKSTATSTSNPLFRRLDLDEETCRMRFPGLFADIDAAVARGAFHLERSDADYKGLVQGCIKDGKLHILTTSRDTLPQILHQRTAILSQIHRALITSPSPLSDTVFAFTINDVPKNNSWGFARPNKESKLNTWVMPTFAEWSWPKAHLGSMDDILQRIDDVENEVEWDEKKEKIVWRGTAWFNPIGNPNLRKNLVKATKGKPWADVQALAATNVLNIEDFCRYKYVVYTEGVTYSGRLPYHQACATLLITAPLSWLTTSALLVRPIEANELFREFGVDVEKANTSRNPTSILGSIPTVSSFKSANAIYVNPDFSNLETLITFLHQHPEVGWRIAQNQRELMVGGGYLSLAAETCYWRALIRGWAKVAVVDEEEWDGEGERYETWLLEEVSKVREGTRGKVGSTG